MLARTFLVSSVAAAASPVAAHDFWIEPSRFRVEPGAAVAVRLRVGEHFRGDAVPRNPGRIQSFVVLGPAGEEPVPGLPGTEPAGYIRFDRPGVHVVAYRSRPAPLRLPANKFERYLMEEGLEGISALRARRGQTDAPGREIYSRSAKALVWVGEGGGDGWDRLAGLPLELVPERSPHRLAPGEELGVRLLFRGEPLAGALVVAMNQEAPQERLAARSNGAGRVAFRLPRAGVWLVKAVHMVEPPPESGADWESFWASLTFELPPG